MELEYINEGCPDCHTGKTKLRGETEQKDLINRLKRIEGQVRGVQSMLEENAYCPDIMVQVAAVNAALTSFNRVLLDSHIRTCVKNGLVAGNDDVIDELTDLVRRLTK